MPVPLPTVSLLPIKIVIGGVADKGNGDYKVLYFWGVLAVASGLFGHTSTACVGLQLVTYP